MKAEPKKEEKSKGFFLGLLLIDEPRRKWGKGSQ